MEMNSEVLKYYSKGKEKGRLHDSSLEKIRTKDLILRHITKTQSTILDIGGGAGAYSFWLHDKGHEVHLIDATPLHIEQAKTIADETNKKLAVMAVGDARSLNYNDCTFDVVLMLGPLYHLTDKADRIKALTEANRVLKENGFLIAVGISRYASMFDGFFYNLVADNDFVSIMNRDLEEGQHRNPTEKSYFTTAFFHHPNELKDEINEGNFRDVKLLSIEGFAYYLPDLADRLDSENNRELLLQTLRKIESEPSLIGSSPHIMAVGIK